MDPDLDVDDIPLQDIGVARRRRRASTGGLDLFEIDNARNVDYNDDDDDESFD